MAELRWCRCERQKKIQFFQQQQNIYSVVFPETYFFCCSHLQHLTKGVNGRKKSTVFPTTAEYSFCRFPGNIFFLSFTPAPSYESSDDKIFQNCYDVAGVSGRKKIHCFSIKSRIFTLSFSGKTAETYFFLPFTPAPSYEISKFRFVPFFSALS